MTILFIALPADSCMTVYCAGTRFLLFLTCLSVFHFSCAFESICAPSIRLNQSRRVMAFHNTLYKLLFTPRTAEQTQIAIDIVTATSHKATILFEFDNAFLSPTLDHLERARRLTGLALSTRTALQGKLEIAKESKEIPKLDRAAAVLATLPADVSYPSLVSSSSCALFPPSFHFFLQFLSKRLFGLTLACNKTWIPAALVKFHLLKRRQMPSLLHCKKLPS